jgi:hypothetical protein
LGVTANPVPDDAIFPHDRQRTVIEANTSRVDVIFAFQFLELQAGMRWISTEQPIGALRARETIS